MKTAKTRVRNDRPKKITEPPKLIPRPSSRIINAITDIDLICRGVVGLTGMAIGFSLVFGTFLICGAISRAIDEISPMVVIKKGRVGKYRTA